MNTAGLGGFLGARRREGRQSSAARGWFVMAWCEVLWSVPAPLFWTDYNKAGPEWGRCTLLSRIPVTAGKATKQMRHGQRNDKFSPIRKKYKPVSIHKAMNGYRWLCKPTRIATLGNARVLRRDGAAPLQSLRNVQRRKWGRSTVIILCTSTL